MSTLTDDTPPTSNHLRSALEYKIFNTQKEERFWRWLAELYDREEQFEKEHPMASKIPTMQQVFDLQWTCVVCQLTIGRPSSKQLDYAIYGHVQTFHDPAGLNTAKSKMRNLKVTITDNSRIKDAWVLKLDEIVIQLFYGADGHQRAQKRMQDFL